MKAFKLVFVLVLSPHYDSLPDHHNYAFIVFNLVSIRLPYFNKTSKDLQLIRLDYPGYSC
jgi:hypothetical protein